MSHTLSLHNQRTCVQYLGEQINTLGGYVQTPFWGALEVCMRSFMFIEPGMYGQCDSRIIEIARRVFDLCWAVPVAILSLPCLVLSSLFTLIGNCLNPTGMSYVEGCLDSRRLEESLSFFHLNCCMLSGGLPFLFGMTPGHMRFEPLVELIKKEHPTILLLSEVGRTIGMHLCNALQEEFAHFYRDIGLNVWGLDSGLFVASQTTLLSGPVYVPFERLGAGVHQYVQKGFIYFEVEEGWVFYTRLHSGEEGIDKDVRMSQVGMITETMDRVLEMRYKPCFLIGDLNCDRLEHGHVEYHTLLEENFENPCIKLYPTFTRAFSDFYQTGKVEKTDPGDLLDFFLIYRNSKKKEIKVTSSDVETFNLDRPQEAISDHKGKKVVIRV